MPKSFMTRQAMDRIAHEAAFHEHPQQMAEFTDEWRQVYLDTLEELIVGNVGAVCQRGQMSGGGLVKVRGLVFVALPTDFFVDENAQGIERPSGLIL